jgi:hypothetical protein
MIVQIVYIRLANRKSDCNDCANIDGNWKAMKGLGSESAQQNGLNLLGAPESSILAQANTILSLTFSSLNCKVVEHCPT